MSPNVKITIDYTSSALRVIAKGGVIAFQTFPNATKHEVRTIRAQIQKLPGVKAVHADKKHVIVEAV